MAHSPATRKRNITKMFGSVAAFSRASGVTERYAWLWLQGKRKAVRLDGFYRSALKPSEPPALA